MQENKDYIKNIDGAERRVFQAPVTIEHREEGNDDKPSVIEGYALKFNSVTTIGDWFREEILPGACDDVLKDDVRCLFNHNPNYVLARSNKGKGTLTLTVDSDGLQYKYETPDVSYARDLEENIRLGNVTQSSFGFTIEEQEWIERDDELPLRRIKKLKRLYDVSPVTYPAYTDTTVAKRSLDEYQARDIEVTDDETVAADTDNNERKTLSVVEAQVLINKNNQKA